MSYEVSGKGSWSLVEWQSLSNNGPVSYFGTSVLRKDMGRTRPMSFSYSSELVAGAFVSTVDGAAYRDLGVPLLRATWHPFSSDS